MRKKLIAVSFLCCVIVISIISCLIIGNTNATDTAETIKELYGDVKTRTGKDLKGVKVKIEGEEDGETYKDKTDSNGEYSFYDLPYMEYSLTFRKKGYKKVKTSITEKLKRYRNYREVSLKTVYMDKK